MHFTVRLPVDDFRERIESEIAANPVLVLTAETGAGKSTRVPYWLWQAGVKVQVTQPRQPCWKIDARCGVEGVAAFVAAHGLAGWYFRVLASGECAAGDALIHVERPQGAVSLVHFNRSLRAQRPALSVLEMLAAAPGLAPDWVGKIRSRMQWLRENGGAA